MSAPARVLVTGGRGFFGSYIVEELGRRGYEDVHSVGQADCDLIQPGAVHELLRRLRPTHVIHAAAAVGGIGANVAQAGWFSYANTMMAANVMESSRAHGAGKVLSIGTVCVYPQAAPVPTPESAMFDGFPAADTAPYGIAKRNLWMMGAAYRKQYGLNAVFLIPTNLYGPRDHFDEARSHVVPALIRRALHAQGTGAPELVVWGDGTATRDLLYVTDAARGVVDALERYDEVEPVNLGTGVEVSVRQLVETVVRLCGYGGQVRWDASKPQGAPRRGLDVRRARERFGFEATTDLETGLGATIDWYKAQAGSGGAHDARG
jgi:GDP-L-fucose synthase